LAQSALAVALWLQTVRRLHDLGRTGWWVAGIVIGDIAISAAAVEIPAVIWASAMPELFVLAALLGIGFLPGDRGENRFGPSPRRGEVFS
jgi:uncharacterized membrane protein YhaH (DUF805 family)